MRTFIKNRSLTIVYQYITLDILIFVINQS